MSRVIALDHGKARCGVASSDPSRTIVTPQPVIERPDSPQGFEQLISIIREAEADTVVVGLPLAMGGGRTSQTASAEGFAGRLRNAVSPVEVLLFDERLTTRQAREAGGSSAEDSRAAAVLLERWLETQG